MGFINQLITGGHHLVWICLKIGYPQTWCLITLRLLPFHLGLSSNFPSDLPGKDPVRRKEENVASGNPASGGRVDLGWSWLIFLESSRRKLMAYVVRFFEIFPSGIPKDQMRSFPYGLCCEIFWYHILGIIIPTDLQLKQIALKQHAKE